MLTHRPRPGPLNGKCVTPRRRLGNRVIGLSLPSNIPSPLPCNAPTRDDRPSTWRWSLRHRRSGNRAIGQSPQAKKRLSLSTKRRWHEGFPRSGRGGSSPTRAAGRPSLVRPTSCFHHCGRHLHHAETHTKAGPHSGGGAGAWLWCSISRSAKSKPGPTAQFTSEYSPVVRAACQDPPAMIRVGSVAFP